MGGQTINTSADRIEAIRLQSSSAGVTVPWVRGVARIAGNLVWYNGFKAIPHTETTGGKGGGVKQSNTTYTYVASVAMALGHGPFTDVPRVWKGKEVYSGGISPVNIFTTTEYWTPPGSGAAVFTPIHNTNTFKAPLSLTDVTQSGSGDDQGNNQTLSAGNDYIVAANGVITLINDLYRGRNLAYLYQWSTGGSTQTALQQLDLSFIRGAIGQAYWSGLATFPAEQISYSGLGFVAGIDYQLSEGAQVENHTFEVVAPMAYHLGSSVPDVDISLAMRELMLDRIAGAGWQAAFSASWQKWSDYCVAAGILGSPALTEQAPMAEILKQACEATITGAVWSDGVLKMVPYADQAEAKYGRTYTPDLTPVYDLDDDCYINKDEPVRYKNKSTADRYNHWRIEYLDRANEYAISIAEAKDLADIEERGLRSADIIKMHWICDGAVARKVAQVKLQRSLSVIREFETEVPDHFAFIDCMDILTITDPKLQLDRVPVRVMKIGEDAASGVLKLQLEDYPIGSASAAEYDHQYPDGYVQDYNIAPGQVDDITIFEAPVQLTTTGLELYIAVSSDSDSWGGAHVWVSLDDEGTNYKRIATVYGPARHGTLKTTVGGSLRVQLYDLDAELVSGTPADALALTTLCYVGGSQPEYLSYETSAIQAPGDYILSGTTRGAYGTIQNSHAIGNQFVRVDDNIAKSGPLALDMIGKEVWVKCQSFNVYGGAVQSMAEVDETRYVVTGYMAKLPPSAPANCGYTIEQFGIRLFCAKNPEPDVVAYEWHAGGASVTAANLLDANGGTSYPWRVQLAGAFNAWVCAIDSFGNKSPFTLIEGTVPGAVTKIASYSFVGDAVRILFDITPGAFNVDHSEVRYGSSFAAGIAVFGSTLTSFETRVNWSGNRTYWVCGVDVAGNKGEAVSVNVVVVAPGIPTAPVAKVVDNNVLLYWGEPATGSLPIDKYIVKEGASYAAGTLVGSNGNSTFCGVFEEVSGDYQYWVAAQDTATNVGPALLIAATVNQPPDYVLRTSWDTTWTGTKTSCIVENGDLVIPAKTTETFEDHFIDNSWATPEDQINAGFPIYIEPVPNTGTYDETFDYGGVLNATTLTVTVGKVVIHGSPILTCQLYYKKLVGDSWTAAAAGFSALLNDFRYVRVVLTVTASGGNDLYRLTTMNVKLSSKLRNDAGEYTITNASTGVVVPFNYPFVDCYTPQCQADGTSPMFEVVIFVDVPNPTGFTVKHADSSGTFVTGSGSWSVKGF